MVIKMANDIVNEIYSGDKADNAISKNDEKQIYEARTFSQEEFNKVLSARLSQQKEKHEKTLAEKLSEAEKLAKMNVEQKAEYERKQFEKQLADREARIVKRELLAEVKDQLACKGLPLELADCLDLSSAESCKKSFAAVENAFAASVEKKMNDKLRCSPPVIGSAGRVKNDPFLDGMGF